MPRLQRRQITCAFPQPLDEPGSIIISLLSLGGLADRGVCCLAVVAVCPNDETLRILKVGTWEEVSRLTNHDKLITGVDWSAQTNKIVTSSQDRNAFVWDCVDGDVTRWEPTLVLLRLTRSATCVRWSPKGDKFAVGSGEKSVCICQFMEEFGAGGGWTSKSIRKCPLSGKSIKSTVLSIAWHPNNCFIAVGSADMKCRVFNAYLKQVDGRNPAKGAYGLNPAEKKFKFGSCIAEYGQAKGWVHDAVFNPSGTGARTPPRLRLLRANVQLG